MSLYGLVVLALLAKGVSPLLTLYHLGILINCCILTPFMRHWSHKDRDVIFCPLFSRIDTLPLEGREKIETKREGRSCTHVNEARVSYWFHSASSQWLLMYLFSRPTSLNALNSLCVIAYIFLTQCPQSYLNVSNSICLFDMKGTCFNYILLINIIQHISKIFKILLFSFTRHITGNG